MITVSGHSVGSWESSAAIGMWVPLSSTSISRITCRVPGKQIFSRIILFSSSFWQITHSPPRQEMQLHRCVPAQCQHTAPGWSFTRTGGCDLRQATHLASPKLRTPGQHRQESPFLIDGLG